jgi:hypothetical protein
MHRKETLNSQNTKNNTWKDAIIKKKKFKTKKNKNTAAIHN